MAATTLYPWQEECLDKWIEHQGRGMVQAATGTGKTTLAIAAMRRLEEHVGQQVLVKIVVPSETLMWQWNRALLSSLPDLSNGSDISLIGGGAHGDPNRKYVIYVINSARYQLARRILTDLFAGKDVLLIADECHHYTSDQNRLIFEFLPYIEHCPGQFFSLGLSATLPAGSAGRALSFALGEEIYQFGIHEAAKQNVITPYDVFHISLHFNKQELWDYSDLTEQLTKAHTMLFSKCPYLSQLQRGDFFKELRILAKHKDWAESKLARVFLGLSYKRQKVVCQASARISCACDLISRLPEEERILVFGERIQQAEHLYQRLNAIYPGKIGRFHSMMNKQAARSVLERFQNGEIRILISCKALDEGYDLPAVSTGIILSGTSVKRQRIQRLGRILRKKEGKNRAYLYYFHIPESVEELVFLPEQGTYHVIDLDYQSDSGQFSHPQYEEASFHVFETWKEKGLSEDRLREISRCLDLGIVRSDWREPIPSLEQEIAAAKTPSEKNYYIVMKWVHQEIEKSGKTDQSAEGKNDQRED